MKEQSEFEKTRKLAHIKNFVNKLEASIVLSDTLKTFIKYEFITCGNRVQELCKTQRFSDITTKELFIECEKVQDELERLSIFSDSFKQNMYSDFHTLIMFCKVEENE